MLALIVLPCTHRLAVIAVPDMPIYVGNNALGDNVTLMVLLLL